MRMGQMKRAPAEPGALAGEYITEPPATLTGVFAGLSLIAAVAIFIGSAAAVWLAGLWLSDTTDVLERRFGFGEALGGLVMGDFLPASLLIWRIGPAELLIVVLWVVGLLLISRSRDKLPWHESGNPPDGQVLPRGHAAEVRAARALGGGTGRVLARFGI